MKYFFKFPCILFLELFVFTNLYASELLVEAKVASQREVQSGFTRAYAKLVLSAEETGRIVVVNGDVGDEIKEAEPFACIDDTFINFELKANKAERSLLKVDSDHFSKSVARVRRLLKNNSTSQSQLDSPLRNLNKVDNQLKSLAIEAETLEERKSRLCIAPPAGWVIIRRFVEPGKWVTTGEPVVEVGDYTRLTASFALSVVEFQALKLQLKQGLRVVLPELKLELPVRLIRVSPAFDDTSRKIHLELELSEGLTEHRGGLRVELPLDIPSRSGAVIVPESALKQRYEQYWLKRPDGTEVAVVYLGISGDGGQGWVRVSSPDIKPGDQFQIYED